MNPAGSNMVGSGSCDVGGLVNMKFTIIKGSKGVFGSLPSVKGNKPDAEGKTPWYPQIRLLTDELYGEFQQLVQKEFAKALAGSKGNGIKKNVGEEIHKPYDDSEPF